MKQELLNKAERQLRKINTEQKMVTATGGNAC